MAFSKNKFLAMSGMGLIIASILTRDIYEHETDPSLLFLAGTLLGSGIVMLFTGAIGMTKHYKPNQKSSQPKQEPIQPKIKINKETLKERILILVIIFVLFLPVRMVFYSLVTQNSMASLGLVSAIGISFIVLAEKNKLGYLGKLWKKHMYFFTHGNMAKLYTILMLITIPFASVMLYWMDRGTHELWDERQLVLASIIADADESFIKQISNSGLTLPDEQTMEYVKSLTETERGEIERKLADWNFLMSFFMSIENEASYGWISHILIVTIVGETEGIGLFIIYRKIYKFDPLHAKT